jgi:hypothetical protein
MFVSDAIITCNFMHMYFIVSRNASAARKKIADKKNTTRGPLQIKGG